MKNGDAQIASPIRIHLRCTLGRACLLLEINLKCAIRVHVADLIVGWSHCDTNMRRAKGHVYPIIKKSETCFNLAQH
jgi:hypothetical protein